MKISSPLGDRPKPRAVDEKFDPLFGVCLVFHLLGKWLGGI